MTQSALTHLEGSLTGAIYDAEQLWTTDPADGKPLLARYDLQSAALTLTRASMATRRTGGLWRWSELLPVADRRHRVYLGEGATPLLVAPRLASSLGIRRLHVKAEGTNPTGSFKARGMAVAVSRAKELGAPSLIAPSAGNAAGALAAYGAAAGLAVTVVMPADVPAAHLQESQVCGAAVLLVEGLISDCGAIAARLAAATGAFDVSTLREPYRVEGKKTMGLELAEDLGWRLPDVVVYPTGGGTGLVGMWKAFDELQAMGLIDGRRPRMVSVQAAGCAPIVRAFAGGQRFAAPWRDAETRAAGLRVPSAIGDFLILDAIRESGGTAVAIDEADIDIAQRMAGRLGLGYVSPETGAAVAAVAQLRSAGDIAAGDEVVVFDTGIGHKYPPPPGLPVPAVVAAGESDIDRLVALSQGGGASA